MKTGPVLGVIISIAFPQAIGTDMNFFAIFQRRFVFKHESQIAERLAGLMPGWQIVAEYAV